LGGRCVDDAGAENFVRGARRIGSGLGVEKTFSWQTARNCLAQVCFEQCNAGEQILSQCGAVGPGKLLFKIGQRKRR
jgi:hypothetical protein